MGGCDLLALSFVLSAIVIRYFDLGQCERLYNHGQYRSEEILALEVHQLVPAEQLGLSQRPWIELLNHCGSMALAAVIRSQ